MTLQIVKGGVRRPQMSCILFGPPGTWKTSTLACAQRALWLDFHGSTKTMGERPDCAWDPETGEGRPGNYPDLVDLIRDIAADKKLRAEHDWLMLDGLDDVEQEFLLPEALRRADAKALGLELLPPILDEAPLRELRCGANILRGRGLEAAAAAGVRGKDVTPFLLAHFHEASGGESLRANTEIILANAALRRGATLADVRVRGIAGVTDAAST